MKNIMIYFKERYEYPLANTVYWSEKLIGPYQDSEVQEILRDLKEVKRIGDVKNIKLLLEYEA